MHQILQSYQNHLFSKLREAGDLADLDPTPLLRKLSSLSCWTISSSNWSSYVLIRGCLPTMFIDLFVELSIPRPSAMKCKWEDAMNITLKLKTSPRPSNLPATSYVPYSSLPPPTHLVTSRDSEVDWIKNSMTQGWDVDFYSGRGGLPNTNSRRAHRHNKRNNNNNSDNSSSDSEGAAQQKRTRTHSDNTMDEDFVADTAADVGVDGPSSPPKENNTASASLSSLPNSAAASSSAPNQDASNSLNASMHTRTMTSASPPNASPNKATADDSPVDQIPIPSPTFSFTKNDYQAAAAPNSAPETLKNFLTNKALIDAVNNTFLETYESYTGKARMTGSGESKRLVIHFQTMEARDACVGAAHQQFPDLVFHAHDPRQLRSNEDLQTIQVTDIPFFLTKDNIVSYFKKFDQKSSRRAFVATLTQLPPNTKDIDLAPLIRELGAKAVNVPLSLNSYKPKRWAYITFPSQELMDAAMEQLIGYQDHTLQWNLPDDTNKLCHRCGKLGCAPNQCPLRQQRGRTCDRNPVAALKERFHVGQSSRPKANSRSRSRSRSRSKGPDTSQSSQHQHSSSAKPKTTVPNNHSRSKSNDKRDRSVSAPISAPVDIPDISSLSSASHMAPSSTQTHDEIQAINAKHSAIENKLDMLANSISGFIGSIASSSSSSDSANIAGSI
ncbi:hypothetical protein RclHR1_18120006 [Rhizophagus clarus]|uniref:RRM domain-containing protein n=1 Tax=Rhizophagus clarus TaxID=94130 RepID=A0A2Z6QN95_9GLOM|nr:hypothetical protein RclHR1_18120006 [Rhizophagus clarus]